MIGRRGFITGLISLVAAPAIVRAGSLMPVKSASLRSVITPSEMDIDLYGVGPCISALLHHGHRMACPPMLINGDMLIPMPVTRWVMDDLR